MDEETQRLFGLLHHYESDCWDYPAPTEGSVAAPSFSSEVHFQDLRAIPEFGRLLIADGGLITDTERSGFIPTKYVDYRRARLLVHAVRRGFENPAMDRAALDREYREAGSITPLEEPGSRLIEAGLGYRFSDQKGYQYPSRGIADYKVVLRLDESSDNRPILRRYERVGQGKHRVANNTAIREESLIKNFFVLFRAATLGTVSEPA
jgi:hypothetical protein